jgi:putative membrane protein
MWSKPAVWTMCLAAFALTANAQSKDLSAADKAFLKSAAEANMTEAHLGKMAEDQATDDAVKNFGRTLVQDHTKAYEELTVLADKTGAQIPKGIDVRRDRAIEALTREKGTGFDRRFVGHEVQDHQKTLTEFQREADKGQNSDVKAYAQKMIPTLQEHLDKAKELEKSESRTASASRRH